MFNSEDGILLNNGMQTIINAFNHQGEKFQNIINDYEHRLQNLSLENESLKNENNILKKEISKLTLKLNSISKTISKENNIVNPILSYQDINNNVSISNMSKLSIPKIPYSKSAKKLTRNTLYTNHSSPRMNSSEMKIEEPNLSYNISNINVDKYNIINQKISKMRNELNISLLNQSYESSGREYNNNNFSNNNTSNNFNNNLSNGFSNISNNFSGFNSIRKSNYDGYYNNNKNLSNKSLQYQRTSNFLKECKLLLNVQNFEKLIQVLKENENCNSYEKKNKVKGILKGNQKLIEIFDNIYN